MHIIKNINSITWKKGSLFYRVLFQLELEYVTEVSLYMINFVDATECNVHTLKYVFAVEVHPCDRQSKL